MPEVIKAIQVMRRHYSCDDCGGHVVLSDHKIIALHAPGRYIHKCDDCKKTYALPDTYPTYRDNPIEAPLVLHEWEVNALWMDVTSKVEAIEDEPLREALSTLTNLTKALIEFHMGRTAFYPDMADPSDPEAAGEAGK